jgi:hypothetical protein
VTGKTFVGIIFDMQLKTQVQTMPLLKNQAAEDGPLKTARTQCAVQ